MNTPPIVSPEEWESARQELLVKEKALTRARDALAAERRCMPWLPVDKEYRFDGPHGQASLLDLFEGRQEEWENSPDGYPQTPPYAWWVWHDEAPNAASR